MFHDEISPFSENVFNLWHYLGPSVDVSSTMMAKILIQSGNAFHRSTYRQLTPDEVSDKKGQIPTNSLWLGVMKDCGLESS